LDLMKLKEKTVARSRRMCAVLGSRRTPPAPCNAAIIFITEDPHKTMHPVVGFSNSGRPDNRRPIRSVGADSHGWNRTAGRSDSSVKETLKRATEAGAGR
jgi:hypothetical protein